jgi:hypothetical protein
MQHEMLSYEKTILQKVSFDAKLFEKELRKSLGRLMPEEVEDLKDWCYTKFSNHLMILDRCFLAIA